MKILIVDAHPPSAQYLCQGLCQDGFNVDVVHDGLQGRNLALSRAYSLLVLDLDLPGQSGRAVLQTLLQAGDTPDRKSVVEGKRVDLGGRRIIKKKKTESRGEGRLRYVVRRPCILRSA